MKKMLLPIIFYQVYKNHKQIKKLKNFKNNYFIIFKL